MRFDQKNHSRAVVMTGHGKAPRIRLDYLHSAQLLLRLPAAANDVNPQKFQRPKALTAVKSE